VRTQSQGINLVD